MQKRKRLPLSVIQPHARDSLTPRVRLAAAVCDRFDDMRSVLDQKVLDRSRTCVPQVRIVRRQKGVQQQQGSNRIIADAVGHGGRGRAIALRSQTFLAVPGR